MRFSHFKIFILILLPFLFSCKEGQHLDIKNGFAMVPEVGKGEAVATFAGGCFWAMQECMIELKGVRKVISGYSGGTTENPSYEEVTSQSTGHAESVQVYYDPEIISYKELATAFFNAHDPSQEGGQGPDLGSDYRSIAFYRTDKERIILENLVSTINASGHYQHPVTTETVPFVVFYGAEEHHQDYYKANTWEPYIRSVSKPKVLKLRKALPTLIKSEYIN